MSSPRDTLFVLPLIGDKHYVQAFMKDFPECTFTNWVTYPRTAAWEDVADKYPGVTFIGLYTAHPSGICPSPDIAQQIIFNKRDGLVFRGKLFDIGDTGSFITNSVYYNWDETPYFIRGVSFDGESGLICVLSCEDSGYNAKDGEMIDERIAYDRLPFDDQKRLDALYDEEYRRMHEMCVKSDDEDASLPF